MINFCANFCCLDICYAWYLCSSIVGYVTTLKDGMSRFRFPMRSMNIFNLPNPSSRTMAVYPVCQSLTEMSIGKSFRGVNCGCLLWLTTSPPSLMIYLEYVWSSTSYNPTGLHGLLWGWLFYLLGLLSRCHKSLLPSTRVEISFS
jgi:hypothetical protein